MIAIGLSIISLVLIWYVARQNVVNPAAGGNKPLDPAIKDLFDTLSELLENQSYFLNKQIKLTDLAEELRCNERDLSQAVNRHGGGNFNKYINSFRVAYAKELLTNGSHDHYTIEAIADECGFSNKVSFYNAFKNEFGMSPAQVRELSRQ